MVIPLFIGELISLFAGITHFSYYILVFKSHDHIGQGQAEKITSLSAGQAHLFS